MGGVRGLLSVTKGGPMSQGKCQKSSKVTKVAYKTDESCLNSTGMRAQLVTFCSKFVPTLFNFAQI